MTYCKEQYMKQLYSEDQNVQDQNSGDRYIPTVGAFHHMASHVTIMVITIKGLINVCIAV